MGESDNRRTKLRCPWCRSSRLIKFGFKHRHDKEKDRLKRVQRHLCKRCGRTTVNPIVSKGKN